MKAEAQSILEILDKQMRLEIPMFQRQYVWSKDHQWAPLWEDIARKFNEYLENRKEAPVHFLGAMVLDQKQTPTSQVERRQVIDGQQRLTTFQIFLAAFRDYCRAQGCDSQAADAEIYILNRKPQGRPVEERFKVWPTQLDRPVFTDVLSAGSKVELEKRYPQHWRKRARKPDPRPRMVEAYVFFSDALTLFFEGTPEEPAIAADVPLADRVEKCFLALQNALRVVVVDLETGDDAQVIFETLNARGEPLLPADLLRNFIFLRASRLGEDPESLYEKYWKAFDDDFWRQEVVQGRLTRPRSDLFMQHFLASRRCAEIPIRHLFVEYKFWIERERPFPTVEAELASLAKQGEAFRRIVAPGKNDPLRSFMEFLETFDIRTGYPLLLYFFEESIDPSAWQEIATILESYLLRRAVCELSTKAYNRIFLQLTKSMRKSGPSPADLKQHLLGMKGETAEWPTDEAFSEAWLTKHAYRTLNNPKLVHILKRLNRSIVNAKHEEITIESSLTIEHLMPQKWMEHWRLPNDQQGMDYLDAHLASSENPIGAASLRRHNLVQTIGNLTIITKPLNSSVSNSAWHIKRPELLQSSLLAINAQLANVDKWDEAAIEARSKKLLAQALKLWPRET